jgi:serine/threonine protein kinase
MTASNSPSETPPARDPVEELAEAFLERYRRGERPALSEFVARAPEHADEIRELFPALVLMEQANLTEVPAAHAFSGAAPERVGDYRIIREVGRGGMGIVYEAEQEALNRHVALKVLPSGGMGDPHRVLRFRREARSAARLHHTNIVPVFDIGERDGVHYYAMQFIHGQSLDQVIKELRRRRGEEQTNGVGQAVSNPASGLAESLVTGRFPSVEPAGDNVPPESSSPARGDAAEPPADGEAPARQLSSTTAGTDGSATSSRADHHYYRSVARIGLQVASALAYAHRQRMLHRDIKPSNLLLDQAGTAWVTDFGLAKEEGDDLTHTGDVVGTLRYIAPERFGGTVDARSDVYSLGLTLYELLSLRPAFPETDRVRLVQAIAQREPATPRKYDPRIPRDLETIVLKAINKEPAGRYARAEALEEDLRRYLSDRPIGARRAGSWERVARWCRRNPGWAGTVGAVIALLLIMGVGGTVLSLYLLRAVNTLQIVDLERTEKLWQANLERARALRSSGRVGQRFGALAAVREAARIKGDAGVTRRGCGSPSASRRRGSASVGRMPGGYASLGLRREVRNLRPHFPQRGPHDLSTVSIRRGHPGSSTHRGKPPVLATMDEPGRSIRGLCPQFTAGGNWWRGARLENRRHNARSVPG